MKTAHKLTKKQFVAGIRRRAADLAKMGIDLSAPPARSYRKKAALPEVKFEADEETEVLDLQAEANKIIKKK